MTDITVVMPTYERRDILARTLEYYGRQSLRGDRFEVVVVDDASSDGTEDLVREAQRVVGYSLRFFRLPRNAGPSAARNIALKVAQGRIIVLVGDDIFPAEDFLEQHLLWHDSVYPADNVGVLGHVGWSREIGSTALMHWLENSGTQFAYQAMKHGQALDYGFLYTSNVSIKRAFLEQTDCVFKEELRFCEDSEWALRLSIAGFELRYNAHAHAEHFHPVTLDSSLQRMVNIGKAMDVLAKVSPENFRRLTHGHFDQPRSLRTRLLKAALHPELGRLVYRPLAYWCERRIVADRIFAACHAAYFRRGLRSVLDKGHTW